MKEKTNPLEIYRIKNLAFSVASQIKTKKGYDLFIDALKGSWNELQEYETSLREDNSEPKIYNGFDYIYPDSPDVL